MLKAIRSEAATQSVPVVMLSSSTEKREFDSCYDAGANSVIRKSIDFEEMRRKMRTVYDFWIAVSKANRSLHV